MRGFALAVAVAVTLAMLAGCVNTHENLSSAGFKSSDEARLFVPDYLFYAQQLTPDEWRAFYVRFPEYFTDMQQAKTLGMSMEYHPWYTAFAFRWTSSQRKAAWPPETVARLQRGEVKPGDDVFMIVEAFGPPQRIVTSNWGSVMAYATNRAYVIRDGRLAAAADCIACWQALDRPSSVWATGMRDDDVIATMRQATR